MGKKIEECYFCGELENCITGCNCSICLFPTKFIDWGAEKPEIRDFYLKHNERFYEHLFVKAKEFENELFKGWRKGQLTVLKEIQTNMGDWTTEGIEYEEGIEPMLKEGLIERKLFYEFRHHPSTNFRGPKHCQICGTNLKLRTVIECEKLAIAVIIGNDCGRNFRFAEELYHNLKKDISIMIRKDYSHNANLIEKQRPSMLKSLKSKTKRTKIKDFVRYVMGLNKLRMEKPPMTLVHTMKRAEKYGFKIEFK